MLTDKDHMRLESLFLRAIESYQSSKYEPPESKLHSHRMELAFVEMASIFGAAKGDDGKLANWTADKCGWKAL